MSPEHLEELAQHRAELERLDEAILVALAKRAEALRQLWLWKKAHGVELFDPSQEARVIARLIERASAMGLLTAAVERIVRSIVGQRLLP
jgi:chorismate mutase